MYIKRERERERERERSNKSRIKGNVNSGDFPTFPEWSERWVGEDTNSQHTTLRQDVGKQIN